MPDIALLVIVASIVDLLKSWPAPLANLVARMTPGFLERAREEAKLEARVFAIDFEVASEKFLRPLRAEGFSARVQSQRRAKEARPSDGGRGGTISRHGHQALCAGFIGSEGWAHGMQKRFTDDDEDGSTRASGRTI